MTEQDEQWRRVEIPDLGLAFGYPCRTPGGQVVWLDDVRLHACSEDGVEAYFELSRHLDTTAVARYEEERDFLLARYEAAVTPLTAGTFHEMPAHDFSAAFGDTARTFVLVERGRWLYRVVYDPRSQLNLAVLETIRID
ncbi:MAG TPA: hypothetical protein VIT65_18260 [Microlunatus sp.]